MSARVKLRSLREQLEDALADLQGQIDALADLQGQIDALGRKLAEDGPLITRTENERDVNALSQEIDRLRARCLKLEEKADSLMAWRRKFDKRRRRP